MTVRFQNYDYSYRLNGKPVFAPTSLGRRIGSDVKRQVGSAFKFPDNYYHLRKGGHVAALHLHRNNRFFCKTDIKNFFYSCGRNRVADSLRNIGIKRHYHYARWSCVKNPFGTYPSYTLPYGFVQSPILASLVLAHSTLGTVLDQLCQQVSVSVFVDDISISSNNLNSIDSAFNYLKSSFESSPFAINTEKTVEPTDYLNVFNCHLSHQVSAVTQERVDDFYSTPNRSDASIMGFEEYRHWVSQ